MSIPAHVKYIILGALLLGASVNMLSTTHKIMQSSKRLEESKEEVLALKSQKEELSRNIEYKKTEGFIERIAREKLNMILPNEEVYLYPEGEVTGRDGELALVESAKKEGKSTNPVVLGVTEGMTSEAKRKNREDWANLLF